MATVATRDPVRQKVFIGPLGIEIRIDAGIIESFTYDLRTKVVSLNMAQLEHGPVVNATVVWVSSESISSSNKTAAYYHVTSDGGQLGTERQGNKVPLPAEGARVWVKLVQVVS